MITTLKRQAKAVEYRGRALEASTLAEASGLGHVRDKHEAAAARWRELAVIEETARSAPSR